MLAIRNASAGYHGEAGVHDLNLDAKGGEVVAIVGLNGAGKTTLIRLALGMIRPASGVVRLFGQPLGDLPSSAWADVGYLLESPLSYPELTVEQNLRMNCALHGVDPERAVAALQYWGLAPLATRRVRQLSLGNRQRVGLASALQHAPRLILLDEPSNALDPAGVIALRADLRSRAEEGAAVLVSSHHLDEVARIADRMVVMNAGHLIGELDPAGKDLEHAFFEMVRCDDAARAPMAAS